MNVRVVVLSGSDAGKTFDLPAGISAVGRGPECRVRFNPNEAVVSTVHAKIEVRASRVLLHDEHSRNGTFVDAARVTEAELRPGQVVQFGPSGPTVRIEFDTPDVAPPPVAYPPTREESPGARASGRGAKSGLTALYQVARVRAAQKAGANAPSQTAIIKAFVQLSQERSSRRLMLSVAGFGLLAFAAIAVVYLQGARQAAQLRDQLTAEGQARAAVEAKMGSLTNLAAESQRISDAMAKQLAESRAALDQQRQGVQDDSRFGPTVTQRFAAGVGLLEFKVGWFNPTAGWLRLRGTPDGQLVFTTEEAHAIAYHSSATCTAFLISSDGWIVTNRHCVDGAGEDARTLKLGGAEFRPTVSFWRIAFPKGKVFAIDPRSMRYSTEHDIGLLRLNTPPQGVPVIPLATGDSVVAGEDVVLLSYPGGTNITMVRAGVSAKVVDEAADSATQAFIRGAAVDSYIGRLPDDEKQFEEALRKHIDLQVLYGTISAIRGGAAFDAVARAGHLQPDVSGRMNVSTVRPDAISYHALGGVAGSSGAPLIGPKLSVVGVNFAGFGRQINGKQYQQSDAVPVSYVLRLLKRP